MNGRTQRLGLINGHTAALAPWIAVLVLSALGLTIAVVEGVKAGVAGWIPTVIAVSGMLSAMSIYFMVTRSRQDAN